MTGIGLVRACTVTVLLRQSLLMDQVPVFLPREPRLALYGQCGMQCAGVKLASGLVSDLLAGKGQDGL